MDDQIGQQSSTDIDEIYRKWNDQARILYKFVDLYHQYRIVPRDYGNGDPMRMYDVHMLSFIDDHPGICLAELSKISGRSKGSLCQIANRLEKCGYIYRKKLEDNAKILPLYVTEKGRQLSLLHKSFDVQDLAATMNELLKTCSPEDIQAFYRVLGVYNQMLAEDSDVSFL